MFKDPAYLEDPYARIAQLIGETPPVFWTPRNGGHWMIVGHEAVFNASREWESFTSELMPEEAFQAMVAAMPPGSPHIPRSVPINIDPPAHTKYRMPLNRAFSPKAVAGLKEDIRALAIELVEAVKNKGRCEFMTEIAEPLPVQVFLKIFGLPVEKQAEYRAIVKEHLNAPNTDIAGTMKRLRNICDVMHDTLIERRDNPRDDVISLLWQTKIDDQPTTLDDLENFCVLLFIAGLDTVMNGMGHGARHLAMNPDLQDKLRADPKLIADAAEEILRRYTFTVPQRLAARDLVFEGARMKKGETVMLFLPGADLDPAEFPTPDRFDLERENKVHIAFGAGPHRCLGSHLARIELQVLYEELLARLPAFRVDPAQPVRFHGGHVIGPDSLHLVWEA
jgi:cytochrome P450